MTYHLWYSQAQIDEARKPKSAVKATAYMPTRNKDRGFSVYLNNAGEPVFVTDVTFKPHPMANIIDIKLVAVVDHPVCLVDSSGFLQQPEARNFCKAKNIPMHADWIEELAVNSPQEKITISETTKNILKGFTKPKFR